ncbi:hypothetical protein Mapa_003371 [Marchantia paleacea]|nr:hypothetical protein Mapa_003371 [Marchantia paleacea]
MLQYDGELKLPDHYLVSPPEIDRTSGEYMVHNGINTFTCSETVKFGHVTFFWSKELQEEYVEILSDLGITFNVALEMKAILIAEKAHDAILSGNFDTGHVNLPNRDMVGHNRNFHVIVMGCATVDKAVRIIFDVVEQVGGMFLVTVDHGKEKDDDAIYSILFIWFGTECDPWTVTIKE